MQALSFSKQDSSPMSPFEGYYQPKAFSTKASLLENSSTDEQSSSGYFCSPISNELPHYLSTPSQQVTSNFFFPSSPMMDNATTTIVQQQPGDFRQTAEFFIPSCHTSVALQQQRKPKHKLFTNKTDSQVKTQQLAAARHSIQSSSISPFTSEQLFHSSKKPEDSREIEGIVKEKATNFQQRNSLNPLTIQHRTLKAKSQHHRTLSSEPPFLKDFQSQNFQKSIHNNEQTMNVNQQQQLQQSEKQVRGVRSSLPDLQPRLSGGDKMLPAQLRCSDVKQAAVLPGSTKNTSSFFKKLLINISEEFAHCIDAKAVRYQILNSISRDQQQQLQQQQQLYQYNTQVSSSAQGSFGKVKQPTAEKDQLKYTSSLANLHSNSGFPVQSRVKQQVPIQNITTTPDNSKATRNSSEPRDSENKSRLGIRLNLDRLPSFSTMENFIEVSSRQPSSLETQKITQRAEKLLQQKEKRLQPARLELTNSFAEAQQSKLLKAKEQSSTQNATLNQIDRFTRRHLFSSHEASSIEQTLKMDSGNVVQHTKESGKIEVPHKAVANPPTSTNLIKRRQLPLDVQSYRKQSLPLVPLATTPTPLRGVKKVAQNQLTLPSAKPSSSAFNSQNTLSSLNVLSPIQQMLSESGYIGSPQTGGKFGFGDGAIHYYRESRTADAISPVTSCNKLKSFLQRKPQENILNKIFASQNTQVAD